MADIESSKEKMEELSKLYIIIHERVKQTLQKCTINPKYDATQ